MNTYVFTSQLSTANATVLNGLLNASGSNIKGIYFSKSSGGDKGLLFKVKRLLSYGVFNLLKIFLQKKKRLNQIESEAGLQTEVSNCMQKLSMAGIDTFRGDEFKKLLQQATKDKEGIIVLIYFNRIISKKYIGEVPIINLHPGKLPGYRGAQPIFRALLHNESTLEVTVHKVDAGIDTGPVYKTFELENTDNSIHSNLIKSSLILRAELPALLYQIYSGEVKAQVQPESDTYYTRPDAQQVSSFLKSGKRYY